MAIYHLHISTFQRSQGRSATAGAAYRSGEKIRDERTGDIHDYTRKGGIEGKAFYLPNGKTEDRSHFWNKVEEHHKRGDAVVAHEIEVSLPSELNKQQRHELALGYAKELAQRYQVGVDVSIHAPSRQGDQRNHHAHIMLSACRVNQDGTLGKKATELDPIHCQRHRLERLVDHERPRWAELANKALERNRQQERIDHRTLKEQGIDREPTQHRGPTATAIERKTHELSRIHQERAQQQQELAHARLLQERAERARQHEQAERAQELERQAREKAKQESLAQAREKEAQLRLERERQQQEQARLAQEQARKEQEAKEKVAKDREQLLAKAREVTNARRQQLEPQQAKTPQAKSTPQKELTLERKPELPRDPQQPRTPPQSERELHKEQKAAQKPEQQQTQQERNDNQLRQEREPQTQPQTFTPTDREAGKAAARARFAEMKRQEQERLAKEQERLKEAERDTHNKAKDRDGPER